MTRKDDYHIRIKNLATGQEEGFMLSSGDKPFTIQGMDNVATRIVDGETLYSDFTNSRVFSQSTWEEGLSKYRNPLIIYANAYPTKKYRDSNNILIQPGEFTLGSQALIAKNFPDPASQLSCMCNGEATGVVYAGLKGTLQIWRSTDNGLTWAIYKDYTSDTRLTGCNEITDILWFKTNGEYNYTTTGVTTGSGISQIWFIAYNNTTNKGIPCKIILSGNSMVSYGIGSYTISGSSGTAFNSIQEYNTPTSLSLNTNTYYTADSTAAILYEIESMPMQYYGTGGSLTTDGFIQAPYIGRIFSYGGGEFAITFVQSTNGTLVDADRAGIEVSTQASTRLRDGKNYIGIIPLSGSSISTIQGKGTITINFDYTYIGDTNLQNYGAKKFAFSQSLNKETLRIMPTLSDCVVEIGETYYGSTRYINNIYCNSNYTGGFRITGVANTLKTGYYPTSYTHDGNDSIYFGLKYGNNEAGTTSYLFKGALNPDIRIQGTYGELTSVGEQSISDMHYYYGVIRMATNLSGWIYVYDIDAKYSSSSVLNKLIQIPLIDTYTSNYIDSITDYNGNIVLSLQQSPGVLLIDPTTYSQGSDPVIQTDVLCTLPYTASQTFRITKLLNTGSNLLIGDNNIAGELYYFNKGNVSTEGHLDSSIYGGFIPNVDKLLLYGYVRVKPWLVDDGQKIAVSVSFDEGQTWAVCSNKKGYPLLESDVDWNNNDYVFKYNSTPDILNNNEMFVFFFPYQTVKNIFQYRIHIKKGTTYRPYVNHVAIHYNLNIRQEMFITYNFSLKKRDELLDGRSVDIDQGKRKLKFLRNTWKNQEMCLIKHIDGTTYHVVPFSDDRTPGQGMVLNTMNSNSSRFDYDNLEYLCTMTFKTLANYDFLL